MENHQKKQVSFDNELLILVNPQDEIIGYLDKKACHQGEGKLHRAFSIFIFNSKGQVLVQKRSAQKPLWPLFWSNSCCSHPRKGETYEVATQRRLREELGVETDLIFLFKFQYQAKFNEKGSENELCSVYIGKSDDPIQVNENEIAEWKYMDISELEAELQTHPERFTPWFKMEWQQMKKAYQEEINKFLNK